MNEAIAKLKSAHDKLMCITLSAQDAVQFSAGIIELRQAISELETAMAEQQKDDEAESE